MTWDVSGRGCGPRRGCEGGYTTTVGLPETSVVRRRLARRRAGWVHRTDVDMCPQDIDETSQGHDLVTAITLRDGEIGPPGDRPIGSATCARSPRGAGGGGFPAGPRGACRGCAACAESTQNPGAPVAENPCPQRLKRCGTPRTGGRNLPDGRRKRLRSGAEWCGARGAGVPAAAFRRRRLPAVAVCARYVCASRALASRVTADRTDRRPGRRRPARSEPPPIPTPPSPTWPGCAACRCRGPGAAPRDRRAAASGWSAESGRVPARSSAP